MCCLGTREGRGHLSSPSSVDPHECLHHRGSLCSCSIALVWALGLPQGVWVLQHKTVNPPELWRLSIRYSHPASCPEENLWPPPSLWLIQPSLPWSSTWPHADITAYYGHRHSFSLCISSSQQTFRLLVIWHYVSPPFSISPCHFYFSLHCHFTLPLKRVTHFSPVQLNSQNASIIC